MGETEARAKSLGQDAVSAWGTQEWPVMHGSLLTAIDDYADLAGLGDEGKKALRSAATTELHGTIVERLVGRGMTKASRHCPARGHQTRIPVSRDSVNNTAAIPASVTPVSPMNNV